MGLRREPLTRVGGKSMEQNMSLLSQQEIDTLVRFLIEKRKEVKNEVLNQESIDKLINLIRNNDINKLRLEPTMPLAAIASSIDVLTRSGIRKDKSEICELITKIDEKDMVDVYIINTVTKKEYKITPDSAVKKVIEEDNSSWGVAISPIVFDALAGAYQVKYTTKTYEEVCERYALKMYGDKKAAIPNLFLPEAELTAQKLL